MSDWIHAMAIMAAKQMQETNLNRIGHVSKYDNKTGMCKVIIPSLRDEDDNPFETGWIQVGTGMVGDGFGIQYALMGGATAQDPSKGEQVQVAIQQRSSGLSVVANLTFNDTMTPPGSGNAGDTDDDPEGSNALQPGELVIKHKSGSFLKFYADGHVQLFTADKLVARVTKDCDLTVIEGDLNIDVQQGNANLDVELGDCNVTVEEGNLTALVPIGDVSVESTEGNILIATDSGNVAITSTAATIDIEAGLAVTITAGADCDVTAVGAVNVASETCDITCAGAVTVTAPAVDVVSATVNLGGGTLQQLCNEAFLTMFNTHIHPQYGGGDTGVPVVQAVPGVESTVNTAAS